MRTRPTLSDVAKLCSVTPATVSRVLNKKRAFSTSPAVRQKILAAVEELGYAPDLAARNLNQKTTRIIAMFASPTTHVAEGIYESLIEGILEVVQVPATTTSSSTSAPIAGTRSPSGGSTKRCCCKVRGRRS